MRLYRRESETLEIDGSEYAYNTDFRVLLKVGLCIADEEITDADKLEFCSAIIFKELPIELRVRGVRAYLDRYIEKGKGKKCFDLEQDAEYIYAAFIQAYRIDLHTAELSAGEFMALLRAVPKGTKFAEIVELRTMELPKPTKNNAEERARIIRAKQAVALKSGEDIAQSFVNFGKSIKMLAEAQNGE